MFVKKMAFVRCITVGAKGGGGGTMEDSSAKLQRDVDKKVAQLFPFGKDHL